MKTRIILKIGVACLCFFSFAQNSFAISFSRVANFDEIVETDVSRGIFRPRDLAQTKASEFLGL